MANTPNRKPDLSWGGGGGGGGGGELQNPPHSSTPSDRAPLQ